MIILPLHTPLLCRQVALCNQEVNTMHRKHTVEMRDMERWVVGRGGRGGEGERGGEGGQHHKGKIPANDSEASLYNVACI